MRRIEREPGTEYVLSISYGKDSLACLGAIEQLGYPLDRIIHAEVWATKDIPADLPPMVEFKKEADKIIKDKYGITVEHYSSGVTYEEGFYRVRTQSTREELNGKIYGWPLQRAPWCNRVLKMNAIKKAKSTISNNSVSYIGIAADEPKRIKRLQGNKVSPLVEIGWTEADCKEWCIKNQLLSPLYLIPGMDRGGCWFCHNQKVEHLRYLRNNHPEYWELMLKWDLDALPEYKFKLDCLTVHDYEKRFQLEDKNLIPTDKTFNWDMINMTEQELKNIEFNRKVKCIETQKIYANTAEASLQENIPKKILQACLKKRQQTAYKKHWVYVDELQED